MFRHTDCRIPQTSLLDRPLAAFRENVAVDRQGFVDGGHAGVGCHLEEELGQLLRVAAHVEGCVHVELQFVAGARCRKNRAGDHLPFLGGQDGAGVEISRDES